jgi:hypothetical protein
MKRDVFWKLCNLLQKKLSPEYDNPLLTNHIPNGRIDHSIHISSALRYLAGGQAMDIALVHGVSHSKVFDSLWLVVDTINQEPELSITFPESHAEQLQLADEFRRKISAGFSNCMGAIDGMLVWIHKPSKQDVKVMKCGEAKFFCGRKKIWFEYASRM